MAVARDADAPNGDDGEGGAERDGSTEITVVLVGDVGAADAN